MTTAMIATTGSAVQSAPAGATGAASAGKTAQGAGFAGMLVQVIGAGGQADGATQTNTAPLAAGLLGVLPLPVRSDPDAGDAATLLALLGELAKQLEALPEGQELPAEAQQSLSELLTALQQWLTQPNPLQSALAGAGDERSAAIALLDLLGSEAGVTGGQQKQELIVWLTQLQQAGSETLRSMGEPAALAEVTRKLAALIDSLAPAVAEASGREGVRTDAAPTQAAAASATQSDAAARTAAAGESGERPQAKPQAAAQPLRGPVWQANVAHLQGASVSAEQADAAAAQQGESTDPAPVWSLRPEGQIAATASVKPAMPAQVPVQQFAEQMEKFLVRQFTLTQGNGLSEAKLTLVPEHLGQVDIRIVMQNGQLTAQFVTESGLARELLESQMAQLRSALQSQGIQVERMEVAQPSSGASTTSWLQQQQQGQGSGRQGGRQSQGRGGAYDDASVFESELERTAFLREYGNGSSINVTA